MKKIFYLIFLGASFFFSLYYVNAKECSYKTFNGNSSKTFEFKSDCPVIVDKNGKEIDIESQQIKQSDNNYILKDHNILFGDSANNYKGQIHLAQAYYIGTYTALNESQNFIISYNDGKFNVKLKEISDYNFTNHLTKQYFFNDEITNFNAHEYLYFTRFSDRKETFIELYPSSISLDSLDRISYYKANLSSNFVVYQNNPTKKLIDNKNYCSDANNPNMSIKYSLALYSDDSIIVSGPNDPESLINENSLPDSICVINIGIGDNIRANIKLGDCVGRGTTYKKCKVSNADDIEDDEGFYNGQKYKKLLGQLKAPLSNLYSEALNFQLTIDDNPNATLNNNITTSNELCKDDINSCTTNAKSLTEQGLMNIRSYCNEIYDIYPENKNDDNIEKRMDECISFDDFYKKLVNEGLIEDLTDGCGMITEELAEKLNYFLDIIKIAGPLIALGLGTVDFIKVIANGDADKEMKTAFKRFMTRLGAAALLFIIPIIIAFLLDIFMKPDSGYKSDNPFCNVIDWDE